MKTNYSKAKTLMDGLIEIAKDHPTLTVSPECIFYGKDGMSISVFIKENKDIFENINYGGDKDFLRYVNDRCKELES